MAKSPSTVLSGFPSGVWDWDAENGHLHDPQIDTVAAAVAHEALNRVLMPLDALQSRLVHALREMLPTDMEPETRARMESCLRLLDDLTIPGYLLAAQVCAAVLKHLPSRPGTPERLLQQALLASGLRSPATVVALISEALRTYGEELALALPGFAEEDLIASFSDAPSTGSAKEEEDVSA